MAPSVQDPATAELVSLIQQFLSHQIETNTNLDDATKESLTVATECIEQAYNVQRRPASNELFRIFTSHRQQSSSASAGATNVPSSNPNDPASLFNNLANVFVSQIGAGLMGSAATSTTGSASAAAGTNFPGATDGQQTSTTAQTPSESQPSAPRRPRKNATAAEKLAAESFKNQGNDLMKQDRYKEAHDCYTRAIEIDDNNAIYYSNRAAASSRLGDHQSALNDCKEAILIDPSYSKAYGRMGLAYASMDNHSEAKKAYVKAVELDPTNESYQNNLKIAEEHLREQQSGGQQGGQPGGPNVVGMLRSMMTNPQVMTAAMQSLQDPRIQGMLGLNTGSQQQAQQNQRRPASEAQQTSANNSNNQQQATPTGVDNNRDATSEQQQQQQPFNPADLLNLTSRLAGNTDLVGAGAQLLSSLQQNNPDLIENMRRMMSQFGNPNGPGGGGANNSDDRNPPPGYS